MKCQVNYCGGMSSPDTTPEPRWLDARERAAWLGLLHLTTRLPAVLDTQMQTAAGLSFTEYIVLAMLSEQPARRLRMSHLAAVTATSLSRLSHMAKRLEARGLLRREVDPDDGRCTNAILTETGADTVDVVAPGHVSAVRSLLFDALSPQQIRQFARTTEIILARVDPAPNFFPR